MGKEAVKLHNQNGEGSGFQCGHWDNFLLLDNKGDRGLMLKHALCLCLKATGAPLSPSGQI